MDDRHPPPPAAVAAAVADMTCHDMHVNTHATGMLSWGQDVDNEVNPYEVGLGWQVNMKKKVGRSVGAFFFVYLHPRARPPSALHA